MKEAKLKETGMKEANMEKANSSGPVMAEPFMAYYVLVLVMLVVMGAFFAFYEPEPRALRKAGLAVYQQDPGRSIAIRENHPRLFVTSEMIPVIRARVDAGTPIIQADMNSLISHFSQGSDGTEHSNCDMSDPEPANWNAIVLDTADPSNSNVCDWKNLIKTGVFLYWMTDEQLYLDRAKFMFNGLAGVLAAYGTEWEFPQEIALLNPQDSLENFYTQWSSNAGIAYDWLYNYLTEEERSAFTSAFAEFVTVHHYDAFVADSDANVFSHSFQVNYGAALALFALAYDSTLDPASAGTVLDQADMIADRFEEFYTIYAYTGNDNGGWNWGTGYSFSGIPLHAGMLAALTTVSGEDWFASNPWINQRVINHHAYLLKPNKIMVHWGDQPQKLFNARAMYVISQFGTALSKEYANWFIAEHQEYFEKEYRWYNRMWEVLQWDEPATRRTMNDLQLDWFSGNVGTLVSMSDWNDDRVHLTFSNNRHQRSGHLHQDANSFSLYYRGDLVLDSGYYQYGSANYNNYYTRAIAHNTVTVYDPDEVFTYEGNIINPANDGGQILFDRMFTYDDMVNDPSHLAGEILHYEANDGYMYVVGDAAPSYNPGKVTEFTRELVYDKPQTVVVFDRVEATNALFTKKFLLHFENEPSIDGSVVSAQVPGHIVTYDGSVTQATEGSGGITVITVFPQQHTITKVGGDGYEFWVNGENYPPEPGYWAPADFRPGRWRIEVSPAQAASAFDNFLHVLLVSDAASMPQPDFELLEDANFAGARVDSSVYGFSKDSSALSDVSFTLDTTGSTGSVDFMLFNMQPSTTFHGLVANSDGTSNTFSAQSSGSGILEFSAPVSQGSTLVLDLTPPQVPSTTTTSTTTTTTTVAGSTTTTTTTTTLPECVDEDGDGYGVAGSNLALCTVPDLEDCDDQSSGINPGRPEICNDGADNNCDGLTDSEDAVACPPPDDGGGNGGGGGGGGQPGQPQGCTPDWECTDWEPCQLSGVQGRTCSDANSCGSESGIPPTVQYCDYDAGTGQLGGGGNESVVNATPQLPGSGDWNDTELPPEIEEPAGRPIIQIVSDFVQSRWQNRKAVIIILAAIAFAALYVIGLIGYQFVRGNKQPAQKSTASIYPVREGSHDEGSPDKQN